MSGSNSLFFFAVFSFATILLVMGCASNTQKAQIPGDSELSPTALEGKKLVEERCTVCHTLDRIYSKREDKAGWAEEVNEMIRKGAKLNIEEREKVIEYLAGLKPPEG